MRGVPLRLSFAHAALGIVGGAYLPFFGAWLAWKGLSPASIGLLIGLPMVLRVVAGPIAGIVADARNDRRGVMMVLLAVSFAGFLLLNAAETVVLVFAAAVPAILMWGASGPLIESVTIRLAERFEFDYGRVRLWGSVSFVAGNILSGIAVSALGLGVLAPWFAAGAGIALVATYLLPRSRRPRPPGAFRVRLAATLAETRELVRHPAFLVFIAAASLAQASHAFYYAYGGLHWRILGLDGALVGVLWPLGVFAEIALFAYSRRVFQKFGAVPLLALGGAGCVLRWTIMAFDPSLPVLVFAQLLHAASFAISHLGAMYFILRAAPPRLSATAQSLYAVTAYGVGMGAATFFSGTLYGAMGGRGYLLMSALGLGATVLSLLLARMWNGRRLALDTPGEDDDAI